MIEGIVLAVYLGGIIPSMMLIGRCMHHMDLLYGDPDGADYFMMLFMSLFWPMAIPLSLLLSGLLAHWIGRALKSIGIRDTDRRLARLFTGR